MGPIAFVKMHGCGNDVLVVDARAEPRHLSPAQVRRIADRHKGVGFDQLVLVEPAGDAVANLRFLNADGSESLACGNGLRCAARFLFEEGRGRPGVMPVRVGDRRLRVERLPNGLVAAEMGAPVFDWREVPLAQPCDTAALPIDVPGLPRPAAVGMGNPHAVFFVEGVEEVDAAGLGAKLERHPLFPQRANIGFAELVEPDVLRLRVFERGAGLTLACGSGACAAMAAARRRGLVGDTARLILDGGELEVRWAGEGPVTMVGPAARVCAGTLDPELLDDDDG